MTGQQIDRDQLRALANAATPGPWYAERRPEGYYDLTTVYNVFHNGDTMDRDLVAEVAYDNAEFIAASRQAVPALLDENAALRARIKAVQDVLDAADDRGPIGLAFDGTPFPAFVSSADIRRALDGERRPTTTGITAKDRKTMHGLNGLARDIHKANADKGFWDAERPLTETTMLIVTELAEAVEEDRAGRGELWFSEGGKPEGVDIELIDALVRLLDLLGARGVDVEELLAQKLAFNASRPAKHGKAY